MCVLVAAGAMIGGDCLWAVALGDHIATTGAIPDNVPFAQAHTAGWHDVPAAGQLVMAAAHHAAGLPGLVLLDVLAVLAALLLLLLDSRRAGACDRAQAVVLVLAVLAVAPDLVVVRLGLFSLPAFAALLLLLRADRRAPSHRIWWVPVLIAVWGNLHGAVLVGVGISGLYLLLSRLRRRPVESVLVGIAVLVAVCANPQAWGSVAYYRGVMSNSARARGEALWAPLNLSTPFQVLLVCAVVILAVAALRSRPPVWEKVAFLVLAVATVTAVRYGVWLVFLLLTPAARGLTSSRTHATRPHTDVQSRAKNGIDALLLSACVVIAVILPTGRAAALAPVPAHVGQAVARHAHGGPILAGGAAEEALVAQGGRILVGNPIDAFSHADQLAYLDYLAGRPSPLLERAAVVLVGPGDKPNPQLAERFRVAETVDGWRIFGPEPAPQ